MPLAPLNEAVPQAPPPVVCQAKKRVWLRSIPSRYSSSAVWLHLLNTEASSVGALFKNTQASKVAPVPGVKASMSAASTELLAPLKDRALPNLPAVVQAAPLSVPVLLLLEVSTVKGPLPSLKP